MIILTDHSVYDIRQIVEAAKLVIDTRNATKDLHAFKDRIIKLGAGNNVRRRTHDDDHEAIDEEIGHTLRYSQAKRISGSSNGQIARNEQVRKIRLRSTSNEFLAAVTRAIRRAYCPKRNGRCRCSDYLP